MKLKKLWGLFFFLMFFTPTVLAAADFAWMEPFNIQAQADPSEFRAKIAARFNIGGAKITAVMSNFPQPADAYVALRLGEMSGRPIEDVTDRYRKSKGQGWGALAKSLGIKPGSKEFHALKRGDDFYGDMGPGKGKGKKDKKHKNKE